MKSVTIHQRNLQILATEMYKVNSEIAPTLTREIFCNKDSSFSLRTGSTFIKPRIHSVRFESESLSFLGPSIWALSSPKRPKKH